MWVFSGDSLALHLYVVLACSPAAAARHVRCGREDEDEKREMGGGSSIDCDSLLVFLFLPHHQDMCMIKILFTTCRPPARSLFAVSGLCNC